MKAKLTQYEIANEMTNAVLCNYAAGVNGIAMQGRINIEGAEHAVYFEIREGEEIDNEDIYTPERIISIDRL